MDINDLTPEDLSFACTCGKEKLKHDLVLEWAHEFLNNGKPVSDKERNYFLGRMIATFMLTYSAEISFDVDQWFAVSVGQWTKENPFGVYVQCDTPEGGLAFALRQFYLKFGEKFDG